MLIDIPGAEFLLDGDPNDGYEYGGPERYTCPLNGDVYAYDTLRYMTARLATMADDVTQTTYTTRDSNGHVEVTHVMRYFGDNGCQFATVRHYPSRITVAVR